MRALLDAPPPEEPRGAEALEGLFRDVLPYAVRVDHPRFFAFVPSSGTWPGALGDFVASALSVYAGSWLESSGPTQLELTVLGWFADWIGFPRDADGQLTSGGSIANLQALACARETRVGAMRDDLTLYVADQAHSSIARAARVLGFHPDRVRVLPTDRSFRLRPETLAAAVDADRANGLTPLAAVASAGATNTGAVDPLHELAEVARARELWLHVDGAYGAFAALTERGRRSLAGIETADSLTLDPHKWLHQSYECGGLLVREHGALRRAFEVVPPYLRDADTGEVNLSDYGVQLSRTARAFKVWLSVQTLGLAAFREAIDRSLDLAEHAGSRVKESPRLELMAPPSLGIVCFRRVFEDASEQELAERNARLSADLLGQDIGFVSSTMLRGRYALRLCALNHGSQLADVDAVLDFLETADPSSGGVRSVSARFDDVRDAWLAGPVDGDTPAKVESVASLPLCASMTADDLRRLAALGREREVPEGTPIVREWDTTREFCILLEGEVEVSRAGSVLERHASGAFFGELAARDWGRGYGYPRTATVTATTPVRLLVFPEGTLGTVMALAPALAAAIEEAIDARLPS
jgi:glutamate/tyrosine decarboxylase-like PLP-dependent enzyme